MWTKVQQRQRQRHEFDDSVDFESSKTKTTSQYEDDESWEEQAFAEDAAGGLGGCVWPPRSYSCSFCRREFRSAQALGGHMNVHRRDRARLKQSPIPQFPFQYSPSSNSSSHHHQLSTLPPYHHHHLPNPKTYPFHSFPTSSSAPATDQLDPCFTGVIPCGGQSDSKVEQHEASRISCPRVRDKDHVGIGVLDEGLNFGLCQPRPMSDVSDDGRDEVGVVMGCKRRKTDDGTSIQFYVKSSSLVERHHHHRHHHRHIQSEVIGISSSSLHDLDLELRLGGLSKG